MSLSRLSEYKGVPNGQQLIDHMDKTELAAHLFRITQTEEKIKRDDIRGQQPLERAARDVGAKVRKTVIELSGTAPEDLPIAPHIKDVKKQLKCTPKKLGSVESKGQKKTTD